jgi:hypothetical protein
MEPRVASNLASFSGSVSGTPGCPVSPLLQLRLRLRLRVAPSPASSGLPTVSLRVAPNSLLPAWPWVQTPGRPDCRACWPASGSVSGLPRIPSPLATPTDGSSGCPEFRTSRRRRLRILGSPRLLRLRLCRSTSSGFPESCFCGWADDDSPLNSNFASPALGRG